MLKNAASSVKHSAGNSKRIAIFWTSGWDSTYMLLKLLRDGYTVQPLYIINPRRSSRNHELRAMRRLSAAIQAANLPGTLLPLATYRLEDIPANHLVTQSFQTIRNRCKLGHQYEYLARFAAAYHRQYPLIALGIEHPEGQFDRYTNTIEQFGAFTSGQKHFTTIDPAASHPALRTLFGNFCFPIITTTEQAMLRDIRAWGYTEIMRQTWFCHNPINDQPCGMCRPCQQKMDNGMSWLLPASARANYARSQGILQYYIDHFAELTPPKQFHFACRVKSWYHTTHYDSYLRQFAQQIDFQQLFDHDDPSQFSHYRERKSYFDQYPDLHAFECVLARLYHALHSCGTDLRAEFQQLFPLDRLYTLSDQLLADPAALSVLSTCAVNFICFTESLFPRGRDVISELAQLSLRFTNDPILRVYLYTHLIIHASQFYSQPVSPAHAGLLEQLLDATAAIITEHYDAITIDAKLEFLVCEQAVRGHHAQSHYLPLRSQIHDECRQHLLHTPYLTDPRRPDRNDFNGAEHRSILYAMESLPWPSPDQSKPPQH